MRNPLALRRAAWFACAAALSLLVLAGSAVARGNRSHGPAAAAGTRDCNGVKRGGTLLYGVSQDVISFDAANTQDNGSLWADMNIYDQLLRLTPDGSKLVPDLAKSWDVKQGGRVIVFHLRKNARFYDGTPLTAEDVKFSYDRTRSPKSVVNWTLEAIKSDRVVDKYTFEVTLKKPWAPFLNDISLWGASIMSKKAIQTQGVAKIKSHPVGSGPFYVAERKPGQFVLLKRNPYYWEKDACGHSYPYLDAVRLVYLPNDNTRIVKLEGGAVDAIFDVPFNLISSVDKRPGVTAKSSPQLGVISIALSQRVPGLKDVKVRQAISYAIDRAAIVKAVFFGHARPATSPIDPGVDFHTDKYGYKYDLAKAKALMKASSVPNGFKATLMTISGDSLSSGIGLIVQSELKKLGIQITLQPLDGTTEFTRMSQERYQMAYNYGTSDNLDPNENMLFCCVSDGGADASYTHWKDPKADALFRKTQTAVNHAQRAALFDQWQKILMQTGPVAWLINPANRFAYRDNVHDFIIQNTAHWPLWVVWKS
jgi:peptide/nickel transport system substrate-binding protein